MLAQGTGCRIFQRLAGVEFRRAAGAGEIDFDRALPTTGDEFRHPCIDPNILRRIKQLTGYRLSQGGRTNPAGNTDKITRARAGLKPAVTFELTTEL